MGCIGHFVYSCTFCTCCWMAHWVVFRLVSLVYGCCMQFGTNYTFASASCCLAQALMCLHMCMYGLKWELHVLPHCLQAWHGSVWFQHLVHVYVSCITPYSLNCDAKITVCVFFVVFFTMDMDLHKKIKRMKTW